MRIVFMETDTLGDDVDYTPFYNLGEVVKYNKSEPEYNQERVKDADVIVVNKIPMNEETLRYAQHVKLICLTATGTNTVDFDYVRKKEHRSHQCKRIFHPVCDTAYLCIVVLCI
ncbi:hypothetical protein [Lacrimispora xylanisolvens]|uniref:hypothetical protein n=1 Tax=Lacrimispora xylanisolvens TaxID=384636 RepID=UPI003D9CAB89